MQRYIIRKEQIFNNQIQMNKDDSYHIAKVMRMQKGDKLICSTEDLTYLCEVHYVDLNQTTLTILESYQEQTELPVFISIAHGLVMKTKMEEVVEKISLLGASEYVFFPMERSNVKMIDEKLDKKLARLNKIAKEASEVAHRTKVLQSVNLKNFNDFIKYASKFDYVLYAYEETNPQDGSFKDVAKKLKPNDKVLILVGPEGGISKKEVDILNQHKCIPITLGPRILRTEVAPTYIMAALSYELEIEDKHEI